MSIEPCVWSDLFDDEARATLREGYLITGTVSVILSSWLNLILLFTNLRYDNSYRNLAIFTAAGCARRALSVLSHLTFADDVESWNHIQTFSCDFFGFWDTFLAIYEIECITHVCIERYVVAKYVTNGWEIQKNHYFLFQYLCLFFASIYSLPPLFGLGRYGYDFSCASCTFDMVLPDTWQKYIVAIIFILRSVKPTIFMTVMLIWARNLEQDFNGSIKTIKLVRFTQTIIVVTFVNLACWAPIAFIRGWVVFSYLVYGGVQIMPPVFYIQWALWLHWVSPAFTAIAMFLVDHPVRHKMIHMSSSDDGEGQDERKNE